MKDIRMEYTAHGEPMDVLTFFGSEDLAQTDQTRDRQPVSRNGKRI